MVQQAVECRDPAFNSLSVDYPGPGATDRGGHKMSLPQTRGYHACVLVIQCVAALRRGPHHPHGQTPVHQKHHHYTPRGSETLTGDSQLLHDTKHIEEDSRILTAEDLARMSPEELEFYYFSAHDFDKNIKLDGLELLKAVYHTIEHNSGDPYKDFAIEPEDDSFDAFVGLVDRTLDSDDKDGDGYISYSEYRAAREHSAGERTPRVLITE